VRSLGDRLKELNRQQTISLASVFHVQFKAVLEMLQASENLGEPALTDRMLHLADRYAKLAPQLFSAWGSEPPNLEAHERLSKSWSQLSRSMLRCRLLLSIRLLERHAATNKSSSIVSRVNELRFRKKMLRLVRLYRPT
jgi:hypothetical protein